MLKLENKKIKIILLIFVILVSAFMIYGIHFDYQFPVHGDEWAHLAQITAVIDGKFFVNPYSPDFIPHNDFEFGYHLIFALFFIITHLNPVLFYQFLPALFFAINSIFLFLFVKKITKNYWIALISILFFLAIPSNLNLLGNWFATPLTFGIFAIYLFFILLINFVENKKKKFLIGAIIVYILSFSYPPAAVLITLVTIFYLLFEVKIYRYKNKLPLISSLLILSGLIFTEIFFYDFIFDKAWSPAQFDYSLIFFYGIFPLIFAFFGAYLVIEKRSNKILLLWPAFFLLNLFSYKLFNFGFFIPYERTFFYFLLGLVPLAGIGLFHIFKKIKNFFGPKKFITMVLIILIFSASFFFIFKDYYNPEKNSAITHLIEKIDYDALKFIEQNYGQGNIILADSFISLAVYPISKNHVVAIKESNLGYGDWQVQDEFFSSDCETRKKISNDYGVDLILSRFELEKCDFMREIYKNKDYIYEVIK